jgi:hypothetical protein
LLEVRTQTVKAVEINFMVQKCHYQHILTARKIHFFNGAVFTKLATVQLSTEQQRKLVSESHKQQVNGKAWETMLENKLPSTLPISVFLAKFGLFTGLNNLQRHLNVIGGLPDVRRRRRNGP